MKNQETAVVPETTAEELPTEAVATRRPYATPRLSTFGSVSALTGGGSGMVNEPAGTMLGMMVQMNFP